MASQFKEFQVNTFLYIFSFTDTHLCDFISQANTIQRWEFTKLAASPAFWGKLSVTVLTRLW